MKNVFYNTICHSVRLMPSVTFEFAEAELARLTFHNKDSKRCWDCVAIFNIKTLKKNRDDNPLSFDSMTKARLYFYCDSCAARWKDNQKERQRAHKRRGKDSSS
jgi:hypothetical protein